MKIEKCIGMNAKQYFFIVEGVRNAFDSWDRADSEYGKFADMVFIGPNDHKLLSKLFETGHSEERKFLRMMNYYLRIKAPLYWWKQFDTYKVGTVGLSCSTMHTITKKSFDEDMFEWSGCVEDQELREKVVDFMNTMRTLYFSTDDPKLKKQYWNTIIATLPENFIQTRNIMLNAETLNNILRQREHHKLSEWHEFCDYIRELPFVIGVPEQFYC